MSIAMARTRNTEWSRLIERAPETTYRRGEAIYLEGDPSESVYLVRSGRIRLSITTPEGRAVAVGMAGPGELFGKECFLPDRGREYGARAGEKSTVVVLPAEEARKALRASGSELWTLLEGCWRDLGEARRRAAAQLHLRVHQRLAALLLDLTERLGVETDAGTEIPHWVTHQELADLVGANRSTVTTVLNDWFYEGILLDQDRFLTVTDHERFREMARGE